MQRSAHEFTLTIENEIARRRRWALCSGTSSKAGATGAQASSQQLSRSAASHQAIFMPDQNNDDQIERSQRKETR